nr:MAG TPA: hypothetical protein [Caudoviricetes sp.]DAN25165.1 MAG TPA: hypothetical protein [Caudoviricetes sp.]DAT99311.1 MAG TPA: hypothetical protein [Caudoviricetes sp.]
MSTFLWSFVYIILIGYPIQICKLYTIHKHKKS